MFTYADFLNASKKQLGFFYDFCLPYIYDTEFDLKWSSLINKDFDNLFPTNISIRGKDDKYKSYYQDRYNQLLQNAKKLCVNDEFVNGILEIAKEELFLDKCIFGVHDIFREQMLDIPDDSELEDAIIPLDFEFKLPEGLPEILPTSDRTPYCFYTKWFRGNISYLYSLFDLCIKNTYLMDQIKQEKIKRDDPIPIFYLKHPKVTDRIFSLINKLNLSELWFEPILYLILTGWFFIPDNLCPIVIKRKHGRFSLTIKIFPETQKRDIELAWERIEKVKKELVGNVRLRTNEEFNDYLKKFKEKKLEGVSYVTLFDYEQAGIAEDNEKEQQRYLENERKKVLSAGKIPKVYKEELSEGFLASLGKLKDLLEEEITVIC